MLPRLRRRRLDLDGWRRNGGADLALGTRDIPNSLRADRRAKPVSKHPDEITYPISAGRLPRRSRTMALTIRPITRSTGRLWLIRSSIPPVRCSGGVDDRRHERAAPRRAGLGAGGWTIIRRDRTVGKGEDGWAS